jgi:hypothetical protein
MGDEDQLRDLHDRYTWEVNAAVGEGRLDLVWQLAEEYVDEALATLTAGEPPGCGRPDCPVCLATRAAPEVPRRRRWLRRRRTGGAIRGPRLP